MSFLIAFHAEPRSGKTTASQPLIDRGFFKASFGDEIYHELSIAFGVKIEELRSHEWKTIPVNLLSIRSCGSFKYRAMLEAMGEDMNAPRTSRYHLQRWATEYKRTQDPLYWVRRLAEKVEPVSSSLVIDDLRFVDTEYPYLRQLAARTGRRFLVIEILRPGNNYNQHHVSDNHLPFHLVDHVIENREGQPDLLQGEVLNYLYPTGE